MDEMDGGDNWDGWMDEWSKVTHTTFVPLSPWLESRLWSMRIAKVHVNKFILYLTHFGVFAFQSIQVLPYAVLVQYCALSRQLVSAN